MIYESNDMLTEKQANEFIEWFNKEIGTDYELNESGSGEPDEFYVMFFDLEDDEYDKVKKKDMEYLELNNKLDSDFVEKHTK